jgi:hypothetical protein
LVAVAPIAASIVAATGRPLVVAAVVASAVAPAGCLRVVALVIAATGRMPLVAPLGSVGLVAVQLAQATNRLGGMPPCAPLLKRHVRAVRLCPNGMLSILHVPALAVLDGLLHRPIPHTATLNGGRPLAQLPRPCWLRQLDRAGLGSGALLVLPHDRLILGQQPRVGLAVQKGGGGDHQHAAGLGDRLGRQHRRAVQLGQQRPRTDQPSVVAPTSARHYRCKELASD